MATITQLEAALVNAHKAGDLDAARRLAAVLKTARTEASNYVPADGSYADVPGTVPSQPQAPSPGIVGQIGQTIGGSGEAALSLGTGIVGGTAGMIGGTLKGMAEKILSGEFGTYEAADYIQQQASKGAEALTYAPRTETGQAIVGGVAQAAEPLAALAPVAAVQMPARAASTAMQAARQGATVAAGKTAPLAQKAVQTVKALQQPKQAATPAQSMGAAMVDPATLRQARAEQLPVPIQLTKGQKTGELPQQRFERETAKSDELGEPLRQRFDEQNVQIQQNIDAFIDRTGGNAMDARSIGLSLDKALNKIAEQHKNKINTLYKEAEKAGELADPVDLQPMAQWLNENRASRVEDGLLSRVQRKLEAMEVSDGDLAENTLRVRQMTVNQAEDLRKFINSEVDGTDPREIRIATVLKGMIDDSTSTAGGNIYREARKARAAYAKDFENVGLVDQLMSTKRGTDDRAIAFEDVLNRVVLAPSTSLDSMRAVKRLIMRKGGEEGAQAWKDIQAGVLQHIRDQATKSVNRDPSGNPMVSAAQLDRVIGSLDKSGKLDYVFGKQGAENLRLLNDVAKDILVSRPGAINYSNTATVLAGLMDVALSGTTGIPAPVATSFRLVSKSIKDRKLKARVRDALGDKNVQN